MTQPATQQTQSVCDRNPAGFTLQPQMEPIWSHQQKNQPMSAAASVFTPAVSAQTAQAYAQPATSTAYSAPYGNPYGSYADPNQGYGGYVDPAQQAHMEFQKLQVELNSLRSYVSELTQHQNVQQPAPMYASARFGNPIPASRSNALIGEEPKPTLDYEGYEWEPRDKDSGKEPVPKWDGKNIATTLKPWLRELRIWRRNVRDSIP